jgi:hypothetical protein
MSFCPVETNLNYNDVIRDTQTNSYITNMSGWDQIIDSTNKINTDNLTRFTIFLVNSKAPAITINNLKQFPSGNPSNAFSEQSKNLRDSIRTEYCFYYSRYMIVLKEILNQAGTTGGTISESKKIITTTINKKLNTITLVLNKMVELRTDSIKSYIDNGDGLNSLNSELSDIRKKLVDNSERLQSQDLAADIQSSMIDYSLEKNESSRNMLAIYGFMNIVAVGMLFYLYTNVKE